MLAEQTKTEKKYTGGLRHDAPHTRLGRDLLSVTQLQTKNIEPFDPQLRNKTSIRPERCQANIKNKNDAKTVKRATGGQESIDGPRLTVWSRLAK